MIMIASGSRRTVPNRLLQASLLARYTQRRRAELGLTVAEAAEQAGLALSEWAALESGWLPKEPATMHAIAETLQVVWVDLDLLVLFARHAQEAA